jgi:uncharacterized membrane protein YGL010W
LRNTLPFGTTVPPSKSFLDGYREAYSHPVNGALHVGGVPLVVVSLTTVLFHGRPVPVLFATGWVLPFVGHTFLGKAPAFFSDPRLLVAAVPWWIEKLATLTAPTGKKKPARVASATPEPAEESGA